MPEVKFMVRSPDLDIWKKFHKIPKDFLEEMSYFNRGLEGRANNNYKHLPRKNRITPEEIRKKMAPRQFPGKQFNSSC